MAFITHTVEQRSATGGPRAKSGAPGGPWGTLEDAGSRWGPLGAAHTVSLLRWRSAVMLIPPPSDTSINNLDLLCPDWSSCRSAARC